MRWKDVKHVRSLESHKTHTQAIRNPCTRAHINSRCLWRICSTWACQNGRFHGSPKKMPFQNAGPHATTEAFPTKWLHRVVVSKKMAFKKHRPHATTEASCQSEPGNQTKATQQATCPVLGFVRTWHLAEVNNQLPAAR